MSINKQSKQRGRKMFYTVTKSTSTQNSTIFKIVRSSDNYVRSTHRTYAAAERQMGKNLHWRCGTCGSTRGGWGACNHHNQVCSAEHYNDKIIEIANGITIIH